MGKITIHQKNKEGSERIGVYKSPERKDWINLFHYYVIISCFGLDFKNGFNPKDYKSGIIIGKFKEGKANDVTIDKVSSELYSSIEKSRLKKERTDNTIEKYLVAYLENYLEISNNVMIPKNMKIKHFSEDKRIDNKPNGSYLAIKSKDPEKEKKIKTLFEIAENLGYMKNPSELNAWYNLIKLKHPTISQND